MSYKRVTIDLTIEQFQTLRAMAEVRSRTPKDQAAHSLKRAIALAETEEEEQPRASRFVLLIRPHLQPANEIRLGHIPDLAEIVTQISRIYQATGTDPHGESFNAEAYYNSLQEEATKRDAALDAYKHALAEAYKAVQFIIDRMPNTEWPAFASPHNANISLDEIIRANLRPAVFALQNELRDSFRETIAAEKATKKAEEEAVRLGDRILELEGELEKAKERDRLPLVEDEAAETHAELRRLAAELGDEYYQQYPDRDDETMPALIRDHIRPHLHTSAT